MSKPRSRSSFADELDIFSDEDFDVETFVDDMEGEDRLRLQPSGRRRAAWQRLEDWREWRRLQEQIDDWNDWEID